MTTPTNPHGLFNGQTLLFVPHGNRSTEREVKVIKVGRVWAETSGYRRISLQTLTADGRGYSSPGRCWLSREAWEADKAESAAWNAFRDIIKDCRDRPSGATPHRLAQAAFIFGLGKEFSKAKGAAHNG